MDRTLSSVAVGNELLKNTVDFTTKDIKCFAILKGRQAHFFARCCHM
jgi:hypothetical protein